MLNFTDVGIQDVWYTLVFKEPVQCIGEYGLQWNDSSSDTFLYSDFLYISVQRNVPGYIPVVPVPTTPSTTVYQTIL